MNLKGYLLFLTLLIAIVFSCKSPTNDKLDEEPETLTLEYKGISSYFDAYGSDPQLSLTWQKATGADVITYRIYYSESDNIGTIANIKTNGTEITESSTPYSSTLGYTSDSDYMNYDINNIGYAKKLYFNILATSMEGAEACYDSIMAVGYESGTGLILGAADDYGFIINGYSDIDSNHQISMYTDIAGTKDAYLGIMNTSSSTDDFYIEDVKNLSTRPYPGISSTRASAIIEAVAQDNYDNMRKVANMTPGPLKNIYGTSGSILKSETVGTTTKAFNAGAVTHNATLRYSNSVSTSFGSKTLKIWVEDSSWTTGGTEAYLTTTMIEQLAEKFLKIGSNNDIYDWVTNIYGEEWGSHSYGNLIPESNEINILLADLQDDNATNGGVLGYFSSKDNITAASNAASNERIMFYIDSLLFSQADGSWEITDTFPAEIVSTLGHEFQHMIGFYQSSVKRGLTVETWVTEMLSLATEDFLAEKLNIAGPRGYITSDGKASTSTNISSGRIPLFNLYMDTPRFAWLDSTLDGNGMAYVLRSYAYHYAFGAYLTRNYGGPELLKYIMQKVEDIDDLESLLRDNPVPGAPDSKGYEIYLVPQFHIAALLSDKTGLDQDYMFNNGGWYQYTVNGIDYKLGSINFYNYNIQPYVFSRSELTTYYGQDIPGNVMLISKTPEVTGQTEFLLNSGDDTLGKSIFLMAR